MPKRLRSKPRCIPCRVIAPMPIKKDLVDFVKRMRHKPKHIRIVHGDGDAKRALQEKYNELLPECEVVIGSKEASAHQTLLALF